MNLTQAVTLLKYQGKKIIFLYTAYCKPKSASLEGDVPHVIDEPGASDVLALVLNRQVAPEHLRGGSIHEITKYLDLFIYFTFMDEQVQQRETRSIAEEKESLMLSRERPSPLAD